MSRKKCPIYNSYSACDNNPDCLFLREGGCAILLGAVQTGENERKINELSSQLDTVQYNLSQIIDLLNQSR